MFLHLCSVRTVNQALGYCKGQGTVRVRDIARVKKVQGYSHEEELRPWPACMAHKLE